MMSVHQAGLADYGMEAEIKLDIGYVSCEWDNDEEHAYIDIYKNKDMQTSCHSWYCWVING